MQSICHHARRNGLSIVPGHARSLAANEPRVGAARCPKKAAQPLARFASMISGQFWRGHVLSAERLMSWGPRLTEWMAQPCRRDVLKIKRGQMLMLMMDAPLHERQRAAHHQHC